MKVLVLFSGGLDSSTCLAMAVKEYGVENVVALNLYYGQRHEKEMIAAKNVSDYYGVRLLEMNLEAVFQYSNCSLLKHSTKQIPKKDYAEQINEANGNPVATYVPFRNGLFLSAAASVALSEGCEYVVCGIHADDAAGSAYPDCSVSFYNLMNAAIYEGTGRKIKILAPFVEKNKSGVVAEGLRLKVPYELTWSCYEGGERPCGKCGTCIDRKKAFEANGVKDPL